MSEKKLRRVLTAAAVATSLFLTTSAGAGAAQSHDRQARIRGSRVATNSGDSLPFSLLRFLVSVWEKAGPSLDPEGVAFRSYVDAEAPTSQNGFDIDQGGR